MSVVCKNCRSFYKPCKEYVFHCSDCYRKGNIKCPYCAFQISEGDFEICGGCQNCYQCKNCQDEIFDPNTHNCVPHYEDYGEVNEAAAVILIEKVERGDSYIIEIPAD